MLYLAATVQINLTIELLQNIFQIHLHIIFTLWSPQFRKIVRLSWNKLLLSDD